MENSNNLNLKNEIEVILKTTLTEEFQIANNRMSVPLNYDNE